MSECAFGMKDFTELDGDDNEILEILGSNLSFHRDSHPFLIGRHSLSTSKGWFRAGPYAARDTDLL